MSDPLVDRAVDPADDTVDLDRFVLAERLVHRTFAVLMVVCIVTAAILYNGALMMAVGHRQVVETIHVWCGFALPVPLLLGAVSKAYRADLGILNRFTHADWRWLRSRSRRDGTIPVGKFNAGQKINSWLVAGSTGVLLGTGVLLYWPDLVRLSWRAGATFVHDWFALGLGLLVVGHVTYAVRDPESRRGMRTGRVSRSWAKVEHEAWADEITGDRPSDPT